MRALIILLLFCNITFAAGDIPPNKGDVTKNIHILLDYSGSMTPPDLENQLNQFLSIAMQQIDEYNLSVTIFGGNYYRMVPGPNCDLSAELKGWMSMPSANNIKAIRQWINDISLIVDKGNTRGISPIRNALREDIKELSVIVISDCVFDDKSTMYNGFDSLEEHRKNNPGRLGFIDIDSCANELEEQELEGEMFALCKAKGWWLMNLGQCDGQHNE